ncbi:MAG TPA: SH3 domain-containing protein [Propylenella sp.]
MKMRLLVALAVFVTAIGSLTVPRAAEAALAYAVGGTTNVRSGPGVRYPVIARVVGGTPVTIVGCLPNRAWCDAIVGSIRGWINARRLEFVYGGRRVLVPSYYQYFGAPIIQFQFGVPSWHWRPGGGNDRPHDENGRPRD